MYKTFFSPLLYKILYTLSTKIDKIFFTFLLSIIYVFFEQFQQLQPLAWLCFQNVKKNHAFRDPGGQISQQQRTNARVGVTPTLWGNGRAGNRAGKWLKYPKISKRLKKYFTTYKIFATMTLQIGKR